MKVLVGNLWLYGKLFIVKLKNMTVFLIIWATQFIAYKYIFLFYLRLDKNLHRFFNITLVIYRPIGHSENL